MVRTGKWMIRPAVCAAALSLAALALSGCGSSKLKEGYWKLVKVAEDDETVKEKDLEDYGLDDAYIVVEDDDDEGYAVFFGIPADFSCDPDKGELKFDTGKVSYKASGNTLTLADENITMTFEKSKDDAPKKPSTISVTNSVDSSDEKSSSEDSGKSTSSSELSYTRQAARPISDNLDTEKYYDGDWYGWWTITGITDSWKELNGEKYDIMGEILLDDDGTGIVTLWDADYSYDDPIALVTVMTEESVFGDIPCLVSTGGYFLDNEIEAGDWNIDASFMGRSNYLEISSSYKEDGEDAMLYDMTMKKWGDTWDDVNSKPPLFDWYLDLVDKGESMPDALPK